MRTRGIHRGGSAGEGVEHADQLGARVVAGVAGGRAELPEPGLVDLVQVGEHEVVLAREVLVERCLRHTRLGDDGVHADAAWPAGVEEPERGVEDPLACGPGRGVCVAHG